ncbi:beta-lactamase/transpeptidase-like protein [Mycena metata]|uniref:Beta-lactamase/transpeptidase-like protein n=1 Tax=Mycena metata TaxID=1033252 RepID=A0AAD7NWQ8_9AGAR|nr:beta-lactamase/transpeptidase-like protein [Mycena metata]
MLLRSTFASLVLFTAHGLGSSLQLPRQANTSAPIVDAELSSYIQQVFDLNNVTGASMAIILPTGEVQYATWGNSTEDGKPVASDTVFAIGSCSKGFLSASVGILMQDFADGKNTTALPSNVTDLAWSTKIQDLLPGEWKTDDPWSTEKTNLRDLLSHVTGMPSHEYSYTADESPRDIVVRMRNLRTAYELRQYWEYCNQMYITASYIVSKYSGMSYRDFVEKRIMLPLNMTSSTLHPDRANATGTMAQNWSPLGRRIPFFLPESQAELIAGAGGVISTAEDMALWVKLFLNGGVIPQTNVTIIPQTTFTLATSGIAVANSTGTELYSVPAYGMGWLRYSYRGREVVLHNGGAPGVSAWAKFYPRDGFGIVLIANTAVDTATELATFAVEDRLLGLINMTADPPLGPPVAFPSSSLPPAPPNATALPGFPGTYTNVPYGNLTICSPTISTTPACAEVVQDFKKVNAAAGTPSHPAELYAAWPRWWSSHLRLSPYAENVYIATSMNMYVNGYGDDDTPFVDPLDQWYVTFMVNDGKVEGLGFTGVADKETSRQLNFGPGGSIRDTADAWFDKL